MKSRYCDDDASKAVRQWGETHGSAFALRLYTAHLIGQDLALVLHGGGNVSFKGTFRTLLGDRLDALYVKASGCDLSAVTPVDLLLIDLSYARRMRSLDALDDETMMSELRSHMLVASAQTPSIETLVHAFLPHTYVDHSHADAVLTLTNQPDGESLIREALADCAAVGSDYCVVSYVRAGFELAKAVADAREQNPNVRAMVLLHHGLITMGEDARTSYERHVAVVDACERFIAARTSGRKLTISFRSKQKPAELAARIAPILRGLLARKTDNADKPFEPGILEWRASEAIIDFVNSAEAAELAETAALTGDHIIRTKPWPLFVKDPDWSDDDALRAQLTDAVERFRTRYRAYIDENLGAGEADGPRSRAAENADPSPAVVLVPGAGAFCWAGTKRAAIVAADITEHTIAAKINALFVGRYTGLASSALFDMEFRSLQIAKLSCGASSGSLTGALRRKVVIISGGAGAIGSAVARSCIEAGAHVVLTDVDEPRLTGVVERIACVFGADRIAGYPMDTTNERSVREGFEQACRRFGGVDVVVPNAGIAHVAPIAELSRSDFQRVLDVNTIGYLLFMREGIGVLEAQGMGGHIIINASKNVFGPGKDFGAYSASKAAGHQLGKVAAIELADRGIRVNMINADAIFGDEETPSGLWAEVGPKRAKTRGLALDELPEYYRKRNLLKMRVYGHHVGNAVVFFASGATPTTGATLPVDGGVVEAFPR